MWDCLLYYMIYMRRSPVCNIGCSWRVDHYPDIQSIPPPIETLLSGSRLATHASAIIQTLSQVLRHAFSCSGFEFPMPTIWGFFYGMDLRTVYFPFQLAADPRTQNMRDSVLAAVPRWKFHRYNLALNWRTIFSQDARRSCSRKHKRGCSGAARDVALFVTY
jgi:hypothetical protein